MPAIQHICWATIPLACERDNPSAFAAQVTQLFAFWPSPVGGDVCFEKAGFTEFSAEAGDEAWDAEWTAIIRSLLGYAARFGPLCLLNEPDVFEPEERSFLQRCMFWFRRPRRAVELSIAERLELSTRDDWFPAAVVAVGDPAVMQLWSSRGHPILWVDVHASLSLAPQALAQAIAGGRPIQQYALAWQYLL